jgi:hypothetical protein
MQVFSYYVSQTVKGSYCKRERERERERERDAEGKNEVVELLGKLKL